MKEKPEVRYCLKQLSVSAGSGKYTGSVVVVPSVTTGCGLPAVASDRCCDSESGQIFDRGANV
ncbi:hypothetical protein [Natronogracilivirga saccharolytica]|uniref:Uncharacterized protein n=1 Tax=Natronogracilivirga saccharolytica TaxID=2812953 RepID=A0A8J7RSH5_9BACT|nr:hypothetical protein [Natronogracilivirga saccharolytica]MBP3192132.1 hypothetical protein [Natronogracilivirga saccharolytica]